MTERAGKLWTDEELDVVARWVRTRDGAWRKDDIRLLASRLERSEYAAELMAAQIAMAGGIAPPTAVVSWYSEDLRDLGEKSRCLQAWKRTEPETSADAARRLGFGDILE